LSLFMVRILLFDPIKDLPIRGPCPTLTPVLSQNG
jgi:hypothetical protein